MGNKNYNINESKSPLNKNDESFSPYQLVFHFPNTENDCINSMDIFNDKVAIGTIMGYNYLIRVDKNNLDVKNDIKNKTLSNNNYSSEKNNLISKDSSSTRNKNSIIKLNKNIEEFKNLNNYMNKKLNKQEDEKQNPTNDITNDISKKLEMKKIKMIRLNFNTNESLHQNSNIISNKRRKIKIKSIVIHDQEKEAYNKMHDITNIEDEDEENNEKDKENKEDIYNKESSKKEKTSEINFYNEKLSEEKVKQFPQISQLINQALENICCIQFDTEKNLNICIGDFEVIRFTNAHAINMNDPNTDKYYNIIHNYDSINKHIKHCENTICMLTSTNYLIIFAEFGTFISELKKGKYRYKNINLVTGQIKATGKIEMHNFSIPFDFDGKDFLFLDYVSGQNRIICVFDTINNEYIYKYQINKSFGHISHMKFLMGKDKKIFLCRNDKQCEIYLLNKEKNEYKFTCIDNFEHIGNDILNVFIYFKESKLDEEFIQKIKDEKKKINLNFDNNNYDDCIKKNNNKSKSIININSDMSLKSKNNEKITLENNKIVNDNILNMNNSSSRRNKLEKETKEIKLKIREDSDNSSKNDINMRQNSINLKNSTIQIFNKIQANEESKNPINEENFVEKNTKNKHKKDILNIKTDDDQDNTIDIKEKVETDNYYIFILDSNGNFNMYKNKINRTIFNLYNVEGIDEIYKEKKFFSIGYPYYFVVNELYFAISTDFGLFVISNMNKEF